MSKKASIKELELKRNNIITQLIRFNEFFTSFNVNTDSFTQLRARLDKCHDLYKEFDETQFHIQLIEPSLDDQERIKFEGLYFDAVARANSYLECTIQHNERGNNLAASSNDNPSHIAGSYDEYMSFYDSFKALIHDNQTLTDIERFHYLRSCLKGDAAQLIACLETTAANYTAAWKLLVDRYDNKRLIVHNHVKALFDLMPIHKESYVHLRQFLDNLNKHLRALECLKEPVKSWDTLLIYLVSIKLDNYTRREWEIFVEKLPIATTMNHLLEFLNKRANLLETIHCKNYEKSYSANTGSKSSNFSKSISKGHSQTYVSNAHNCIVCKQNHKLTLCDKFLEMSPKIRYSEIKKFRLCANCLSGGHKYSECHLNSNCNLCKKKHHVLLHFGNANEVTSSDIPKNIENTEEHNSVIACNTLTSNEVLLSTAIVIVYDSAGVEHNCRVLLDSGSQSNYITNEFCQRLKLKKYNLNMSASGLGQIHVNVSHQIKATIKSRFNNFKQNLSFLVLDKITDNLPLNKICLKNVVMPENIQLADPTCNVSSKIDALLGASVFWNLLSIGQIKISNSFLIAQKTKLGWILSGQVGRQIVNNGNRSVCNLSMSDQEIQKQLENFWNVEQCEFKRKMSPEEIACENHFVSTHLREMNGRFSVRLPLRHDISLLGFQRINGPLEVSEMDSALYTLIRLAQYQKEVKFWRGAMFVLIVLQRFMKKTTRINDIYQDYCVIFIKTSPYFKQLTNLNEVNMTQILTIQIKSKLTFDTFLSLTNKIKYVVRRKDINDAANLRFHCNYTA
ncbi:hypothetical protein NQ317_006905 [Molorchus minor]|uniref:DUF1758 domain-containing protein n=1 Tax=Molorchus minor TaxID=1323400 RepID=A0ABQ9J7H6_9CUCU|nr:hypothetical protein NQ317_006905 [Molorchus minor]